MQRPNDSIRQLPAQRDHVSFAVRMHRVREQDDVRIAGRIDPDRGACESRVPKGADGKQLAARAGVGRVDIPPQSAQDRSRSRLLRRSHLLNRFAGQNLRMVAQQILRKLGQIIRRRKQPRVPRHSAHPSRRGIVHYAAQHNSIVVVLRGSDARHPARGRKKRRLRHVQRSKHVRRRVFIQRHAGDFLHDKAEHFEIDVAINKPRAWRIRGLNLHRHFEGRVAAVPRFLQIQIGRQAGKVRHQARAQ